MEFFKLTPTRITPSLCNQVPALFAQLNDRMSPVDLAVVMESSHSKIHGVACTSGEKLVGMAFLAVYKTLSGHKGMVEDVVVHMEHRKQGIAKRLMQLLLEEAEKEKLDQVLLYTGYHRKPAMALYESLGFQKKESSIYSYVLGKTTPSR
ncbi:MAG: N-acetyltransferase family protein [Flavobacteriaceae bacterium]